MENIASGQEIRGQAGFPAFKDLKYLHLEKATMESAEILVNFNHTFDIWSKALDSYSLEKLALKPNTEAWSIGQVYMHLIEQTLYYNIPQLEICLSGNKHSEDSKTQEGEEVFGRNAFPEVQLKSPATAFETPKQPGSMEEIRLGLNQIWKSMNALECRIEENTFTGKAKHPGFGYLNATEWYQFIEMHMRHHLHQKKRLDAFLATQSS